MKASNRKPLEIGYEIETIPYNSQRDGAAFGNVSLYKDYDVE